MDILFQKITEFHASDLGLHHITLKLEPEVLIQLV